MRVSFPSTSSDRYLFSPINIYRVTLEILAKKEADFHVMYPLLSSDFTHHWNVLANVSKTTSRPIKYHKNLLSWSRVDTYGKTDG